MRRLKRQLNDWGYEVITTPVDEFLLAGGAVKCLCLIIERETCASADSTKIVSPIRSTHVELAGHLLDSGLVNRLFDLTAEAGGEANVENLAIGQRHDQPSTARVRIIAPSAQRLDLIVNRLMPLGAHPTAEPTDARLESVAKMAVAPSDFYSTTIYPTDVRVGGQWIRVTGQRMDGVIVIETNGRNRWSARCSLIRDLKVGDEVVCGVEGVRINRPLVQKREGEFAFMSAGVSTERRVELAVDQLAWEVKRIKARNGRIVFVAGPVVIHTGGGKYLGQIIRLGYVQALLTGNALPVHDIELNLFGTSLGVDLARGVGVHGCQPLELGQARFAEHRTDRGCANRVHAKLANAETDQQRGDLRVACNLAADADIPFRLSARLHDSLDRQQDRRVEHGIHVGLFRRTTIGSQHELGQVIGPDAGKVRRLDRAQKEITLTTVFLVSLISLRSSHLAGSSFPQES